MNAIPNPRLIRLVAGNYRDMQGLVTVGDGVLLSALGGPALTDSAAKVVVLVALILFYFWIRHGWGRRRLDSYYASRCGRVGSTAFRQPGVVFVWSSQGILFPHLLIDFHVPTEVTATCAALLLAGPAVLRVSRGWPYRMYWLLPGLVGIVSATRILTLGLKPHDYQWQYQTALAYASALVIAGLLDHALLLTTLRTGEAEHALSPEP